MPREEVFLPVQRQVIAELGDDDLSDQPGPAMPRAIGRTGGGGLITPSCSTGRRTWVARRRGLRASPGRTRDLALVLANAVLGAAAAGALLVRFAQVLLVPKVRQLVEVEFSATATPVGLLGETVLGVGSAG